ncbi:hypothetical protein PF005_g5727 [Phytophthora fragariae]|uniref:Secreted protein n=2 Tax=Phytophthora TaxID=4783 RepID=A0A6A3TA80_9STRA|nr:hypothetical protein PF003_g31535 [Phytophthora fragariae]KAE9331321.1 hypothetical protein PR003_g15067 [Phytophthora rubi]KAE8944041.1 hypothetical protein PF009_g6256 [Phytophthora fragariae]KAE9022479.1 hypothetical protein PF011_g4429 [Phytophthora fragariae]KAE9124211.1 hypothetical protein PF010_g6081 [Phytophthora fragariae]
MDEHGFGCLSFTLAHALLCSPYGCVFLACAPVVGARGKPAGPWCERSELKARLPSPGSVDHLEWWVCVSRALTTNYWSGHDTKSLGPSDPQRGCSWY